MAVYRCKACGYLYDEDKEDRPFSDIDYCPKCRVPNELFELVEEDNSDE